jgi:hypothetical protein
VLFQAIAELAIIFAISLVPVSKSYSGLFAILCNYSVAIAGYLQYCVMVAIWDSEELVVGQCIEFSSNSSPFNSGNTPAD